MRAGRYSSERALQAVFCDWGERNAIVFGSFARGDDCVGSDLDVVVIVDSDEELWTYQATSIGGFPVDLNLVSVNGLRAYLSRSWEWRVNLRRYLYFGNEPIVSTALLQNRATLDSREGRRATLASWIESAQEVLARARNGLCGWSAPMWESLYLAMLVDALIWKSGGVPFRPHDHLRQAAEHRSCDAITEYVQSFARSEPIAENVLDLAAPYAAPEKVDLAKARWAWLVSQGRTSDARWHEKWWLFKLLPKVIAARSDTRAPAAWSEWPDFIERHKILIPVLFVEQLSHELMPSNRTRELGGRLERAIRR